MKFKLTYGTISLFSPALLEINRPFNSFLFISLYIYVYLLYKETTRPPRSNKNGQDGCMGENRDMVPYRQYEFHIYIYRLWSFHGSLFDQVETGISVCVCATVYECHQLALEQNPWPYLGNWSVSVRIPQILS